jgi:hypothetical protein
MDDEKNRKPKVTGPPKIITDSAEVRKIVWQYVKDDGFTDLIDDTATGYDFLHMPDELRHEVLAWLLDASYERFRMAHRKKDGKTISQNMYARRNVKIDQQLFSMYKNSLRKPNQSNVDRLADHYGPVVYDILGVPRRISRDKKLAELENLWHQADDRFKAEMLERIQNHVMNKSE